MKIQTKARLSTKFWLKVWQNWAFGERISDVDIIEKYVSNFVMLIINNPWQNFLLAKFPNITRTINP
jgi:hypothetical protein